jgi:hypothetical protein
MQIRSIIPLLAFSLSTLCYAADAPQTIGDFGPTGLEVYAEKDLSLKIASVMPGSPSDGKLSKGQFITAINGRKLPSGLMEQRRFLANLISEAEASDGLLTFTTKAGAEVPIQLEVLGAYSATWPVDCAKTEKIIRAHADYLGRVANEGGLTKHNMNDALGILALLSTGEPQDLEVVRAVYQKKMQGFDPQQVGSHTWHNGYSGIAVCEYYLRTGDKSVMPYINAICEAARKWQVNGGWTHWATGVNPQYVGGGLLNAAGTNLLTTLLLAKQCGAEVDDQTLQEALRFFYRFVGHGANPYGDHRGESGYGSNNGKTEQIAVAMQIATHSDHPEIYALARDKAASSTLYAYPYMLNGHTGAIGNIWYGLSTGYLLGKKPELYRNWFDQTHWYYELSRRHDGSLEMSGTGRYDKNDYGRATVHGLTAPRKALQINGAPKSKYSLPLSLPQQPWGNEADLAFLKIDGGPDYTPLSPIPHTEFEKIASASSQELKGLASHPEHVYRQAVAAALRQDGQVALIEPLLKSADPFARHSACLAINQYEPWQMRYSKGWLSGKSLDPSHFTEAMFESLMQMVRDPEESLWLKDQALIALAQASPQQILVNLDAILPWLEQREEWWLNESALFALFPALETSQGCQRLLPLIGDMITHNPHTKSRGTFDYFLLRNMDKIPQSERHLISKTLKNVYAETPDKASVEGEMDLTGITSFHLASNLQSLLLIDPTMAPAMAKLSAQRLDDLRPRERAIQIDALIDAAQKLEPAQRKQVGEILTTHYRSSIFEENAEVLSPDYDGWVKSYIQPLNKILAIDELNGHPSWELLDNNAQGKQDWLVTSFEPSEKRDPKDKNRYRPVTLPERLEGWFSPEHDTGNWKSYTCVVGTTAPFSHRNKPAWQATQPENAGEVIFMQKTFQLEDLDYKLLRLVAYTRQGYDIYINGQKVVSTKGRSKNWNPRITYEEKNNKLRESLKPGTNVLTAKSFLQYFRGKEGDIEVYLEGLREMPKPN